MTENFEKDEFYIKLTGKANIPERLNLGENYEIHAKGSITKEDKEDGFNGTRLITAKFEPVVIEIKDNLGKSIKAKDPRRNSQKIRSFLFKLYADEGYVEDFDSVYDAATLEIMSYMPQILRAAIKRVNKEGGDN